MSADPYLPAARLAARSQVARARRVVQASASRAFTRSLTRDLLLRVGAQFRGLDSTERVRSAGIAILVATMTQATLSMWVPPMARPAPPGLLRLEIGLLAVLLIVLAKPLAAGWPGSRLHQWWSRAASGDDDTHS